MLRLFLHRILAVIFSLWLLTNLSAEVVLNEWLARNTTGHLDIDRKSSDWIELYNAGAESVDLGGYYLTDDSNNFRKWQFPATNLPPNSYLLVYASGRDRRVAGRQLHTNFELSGNGEFLALVKPGGLQVEHSVEAPAQFVDISYGRAPAGSASAWHYFSPPTPGSANFGGEARVAPEVAFSIPEGVYPNEVTVGLATTVTDGVIRYTLTGVEPGPASPIYTAPIRFTTNVVVRARVYAPGFLPSPTDTRSYWVAEADVQTFSSNLPIMIASTFGKGLTPDTKTPVSIRLLEPGTAGRTTIRQGPSDFTGRGTLKVRGSSSLMFPKQSLALELVDEKADDSARSLLGLSEDSDWVLYAPYTDKTLMRDVLAYELSNRIGRYAPRTRFIEMYIDYGPRLARADYAGVYVLVERLTRNPERIPIEEMFLSETAEPEISGGYILKNDRLDPTDAGFRTTLANLCYVEPKEREIPAAQTWIRNWLMNYEKVLLSTSFTNPVTGYRAYIDTKSFVDHHLLVELAKNIDGFRLSTYMYKPRGGKLVMGPIWDYNLTFGNADYAEGWRTNGWYSSGMSGTDYPWYSRLFRDPDFAQEHADRWTALRKTSLRTDAVLKLVDDLAAELEEAQQRNFVKWRILGVDIWPNWYVGATYRDEVNWMKTWIAGRLGWLDRSFMPVPSISRESGEVLTGTVFTLGSSTNAVYYTLDGSDPRLPGGGISSKAIRYLNGAQIRVTNDLTIVARSKGTNLWSGANSRWFRLATIDQSWLNYYFSHAEIENPALSGPEADADGDGGSNAQEYFAGTNPRDKADAFSLRSNRMTNGRISLVLKVRGGKRYRIERATGLDFNEPQLIEERTVTVDGEMNVERPVETGPSYFRALIVP